MSYNFYDVLVKNLEQLLAWTKFKRSMAYDKWFINYMKSPNWSVKESRRIETNAFGKLNFDSSQRTAAGEKK